MGVYLIAIILGIVLSATHKGLESVVARMSWFWGVLAVTITLLVLLLAQPLYPGLGLRWYFDALHNNDFEKFLIGLLLGIFTYQVLVRLRRENDFKISDHGRLVAIVMVTLFFAGVFLPDLTDQAARILSIKTPIVEATFASTKTSQAKLVEKKRNKETKDAVSIDSIGGFKFRIVQDELYDAYTRIKKDRTVVSLIAANFVNNQISQKIWIPHAKRYLSNWKFLEYYISVRPERS